MSRVRHMPTQELAALGGRPGILLVQVPYRGGGLRIGPVGAIPMANAYNSFPQTFLPVPTTPDEWLSNAADAQRLDKPLRVLLVTSDAAPLLDLAKFASEHESVKVWVIDDDA